MMNLSRVKFDHKNTKISNFQFIFPVSRRRERRPNTDMILQIVTYLKEFSTVTVVTEDLMLRTFSFTTFILMFLSIMVTGSAMTIG